MHEPSRTTQPSNVGAAGVGAPDPSKSVHKVRPQSLARYAQRVWPRVAAALVLVFTLRWSGLVESLVFYVPSRNNDPTPPGAEEVWITTPDGVKLHGWFVRAADAAPGEKRPAVLHCHGNAGNIADHLGFSQFLTQRGMHVLIFDYRGYGESDEDHYLTRAKLRVDSLAAFDYLASRPDVDATNIGVYGVSLGGGFALRVAAERPNAKCVCTLAGFSSWPGVASDHVPVLGRWLIAGSLEPREAAEKLGDRAYLVVHGTRDGIVPPRHAGVLEAAAKAAGTPVAKIMIDGAAHNDIIEFEATRRAIGDFFASRLGAGSGALAPALTTPSPVAAHPSR
ncbi:MAG: alpha/beta fold hydrolase [Tepidisphaera sp.]|nr:alpha/beta fold hydrolase [Tepidisphaera sp.]